MNVTDLFIQAHLKHLDSIISLYDFTVEFQDDISSQDAIRIITRAQSVVTKISGPDSSYVREVELTASNDQWHESYKAERIIGVLKGLRDEIQDGSLESLPEHVRGELFDDFLDMAKHLCDEGYKDAAAVLAGGSLETHLKRLARKHNIDILINPPSGKKQHKRAEILNQELQKARVYSLFDQKQITAWLDLRNSAAHGNYSDYESKQVILFIELDF